MTFDVFPNVVHHCFIRPYRLLVIWRLRAKVGAQKRTIRRLESELAAERQMNVDLANTAEAMRKCLEQIPTAFAVFLQREARGK